MAGDSVASGPVSVSGCRKLKVNIRDNELGQWIRIDYPVLQDWKRGIRITYQNGNAVEEPWGSALKV